MLDRAFERKGMEVREPEIILSTKTTLTTPTEPTSYMTCALIYAHMKTAEIPISYMTVVRTGFNTRIRCIEGYGVVRSIRFLLIPTSRNIESTYTMNIVTIVTRH